jgi:hypothetical protein
MSSERTIATGGGESCLRPPRDPEPKITKAREGERRNPPVSSRLDTSVDGNSLDRNRTLESEGKDHRLARTSLPRRKKGRLRLSPNLLL